MADVRFGAHSARAAGGACSALPPPVDRARIGLAARWRLRLRCSSSLAAAVACLR